MTMESAHSSLTTANFHQTTVPHSRWLYSFRWFFPSSQWTK